MVAPFSTSLILPLKDDGLHGARVLVEGDRQAAQRALGILRLATRGVAAERPATEHEAAIRGPIDVEESGLQAIVLKQFVVAVCRTGEIRRQ